MDIFIDTQTLAVTITILVIGLATIIYMTNNQDKMSSSKSSTSTLQTVPIPTPTYGPSGSFTVLAKTFIPNATPAEVLATIRNTNTWSQWNGFTPTFTFSPSSVVNPASGSFQKTKTTPVSKAGSESLGSPSDPALVTGKPGWLDPGSAGEMAVFMSGDGLVEGIKKSRDQGIIVTVLELLTASMNAPRDEKKGYRIAWKSVGYAQWQMFSERVTELVEVDEEGQGGEEGRKGTEYVCWETFGGVLGPVVRLAVGGTLKVRFMEYADGLRGFCGEGKGN
ncbi:hypothetical protein ONS95_011175 [Cadophora gregata]|uniref:uncharacterized protein n=1 Tax=Cadophora gregata TaxID=51156 RepID=UPI0026DC85EE|nr:uncharacterized protein ONS95_011175 [Cadophora gregata]KAK0119740.1 hypothetical protein ONS95_011175 [Cadophora gregata]